MSVDLTDPIFGDEGSAWKYFESIRWPDGPVCPHCGVVNAADPIVGKTARHGLYRCRECRKQFTATVGQFSSALTFPCTNGFLPRIFFAPAKKGMSAHQLFRMLGFGSYRTAWFMAHRIREAMGLGLETGSGPLGGANKVVEIDETYVGGKAKNRAYMEPEPKKAVVTLVEREGRARSFLVANVTAKTLRPIVNANASKASALLSDESTVYPKMAPSSPTIMRSTTLQASMCASAAMPTSTPPRTSTRS